MRKRERGERWDRERVMKEGDYGEKSRGRIETVLEGAKDPLLNQSYQLAFSNNCTEG